MKQRTIRNDVPGALKGLGEAKEMLRVACLTHVSSRNKRFAVHSVLKECPEVVRFQEAKAAVWLLT